MEGWGARRGDAQTLRLRLRSRTASRAACRPLLPASAGPCGRPLLLLLQAPCTPHSPM